ncbi:histidine kinase dimerization/phospho-acceptor domain-containing protein [Streptomyces sp. NPDC059697]|uniref:histidine kinase dimerization/phospho-acceptor domain-containing protein n=1 Tax=Streptomyces sp. NPDC059697 TaxID=3346912 RepID=UPI0036C4C956
MTAAARRICADNLRRRPAVRGPDDELKAMADTFDDVLARLEGAFEAQKRFVANASHELRTPLTLQQAIVDVALADPDASVESLRAACLRVRAAGREQERLNRRAPDSRGQPTGASAAGGHEPCGDRA